MTEGGYTNTRRDGPAQVAGSQVMGCAAFGRDAQKCNGESIRPPASETAPTTRQYPTLDGARLSQTPIRIGPNLRRTANEHRETFALVVSAVLVLDAAPTFVLLAHLEVPYHLDRVGRQDMVRPSDTEWPRRSRGTKMIPTIEEIVDGLIAGNIGRNQAIGWLNQHAADAGRDLRDDFAAQALIGLCANSIPGNHHSPKVRAREAYEQADAMLAAKGHFTTSGSIPLNKEK